MTHNSSENYFSSKLHSSFFKSMSVTTLAQSSDRGMNGNCDYTMLSFRGIKIYNSIFSSQKKDLLHKFIVHIP